MKKLLKTRILPLLAALVLLISALVIPISASESQVALDNVVMDPVEYTGIDGAAVNVYGSLPGSVEVGTVLIAVVDNIEYGRHTLSDADGFEYGAVSFDVGEDLHYGTDFDACGSTGWYWTGDSSVTVTVYYEGASSDDTPTGAKTYLFRNVGVTAATCSMMSPVPVSGITYYVEYDGETYGSQAYTGISMRWTVDCGSYGSVCLSYDSADGWFHDCLDTELTFSVYFYSGSADGSVNWVTCNHCNYRYDGDVFSECPYAICDLNLSSTLFCWECHREYFSTFSRCPYYDCPVNEVTVETVNWVYCSTCYKRYDGDVFSSCPYVSCKLNYIEQVSWKVCETCDKRYESSFGSCPYASCSSNTVTHPTCSTCHREYFSSFTSCPYADCSSNAVKWKTCEVCQGRYDSDVFTDCPYADCDLNDANEVVWVICGVCNNRYEDIFADCPYADCEKNAEDDIVLPEMANCKLCGYDYDLTYFDACPYFICPTNAIDWKECSTCHERYEGSFVVCPYAACDLNKNVVAGADPHYGASASLASTKLTFRCWVSESQSFTYVVSAASVIDASGVIRFDKLHDDFLSAVTNAGYTESSFISVDVIMEWDDAHSWQPGTYTLLVTAPLNVQTVDVYDSAYNVFYKARLEGSSGSTPRRLVFDTAFSGDIHCIGMSFVEGVGLWTASVSFFTPDYNVGYNSGYSAAVENLESVYESALETFYNQGYRTGVNEGYDSGYEEGKMWGAQIAAKGSFRDLMSAVVDAPVKAFTGLLNFEVLGQNMLGFMGSLLTICLVLFLLKKVMK